MSYSRWSESRFYTYWAGSPDGETRDSALFDICGLVYFTAKQLRDNLDKCIARVKELDPEADQFEIAKLKICVAEFLYDVDEQYPDNRGLFKKVIDKIIGFFTSECY